MYYILCTIYYLRYYILYTITYIYIYTMCVRSSVALQSIGATQSLGLKGVDILLKLKWRVALGAMEVRIESSNYG